MYIIGKFVFKDGGSIYKLDARPIIPQEMYREFLKKEQKDGKDSAEISRIINYYYAKVDDSYSEYDQELFALHVGGLLSNDLKHKKYITSFISDEMVNKLEWIKYEPVNEDYKEYLLLAYVNESGELYNVWNYYENVEVLKRHMVKSKTGCNIGISKIYYQSYPNWKTICKERVNTHSSDYIFNLDDWTELVEIENEKENHYSFHNYPLSKIVFNKYLTENEFIEMFDLDEVDFNAFKLSSQIENDLMISIDINYTNKETPFIIRKGQKSNDISRTVRKYRG